VLEEHKLNCIKEDTICHICSKSVKYIENHLARKHKLTKLQCGLCKEQVTLMGELNTHLKTTHLPQIVQETGLGTCLTTEDKVERENIAVKIVELYVTNTEDDNKYQCGFCKTKTTTGTQMLTHVKFHLGYNFKRGQEAKAADSVCPSCGKLVRKYQMKSHKCREVNLVNPEVTDQGQDEHTEQQRNIENTKIEKGNQIKKKKVNTIKSESSNELVQLPCDQCERVFQRIANLRKHKLSFHENGTAWNLKIYSCQHCEKEFKCSNNLKKHILAVHENFKYECEQCEYRASDPSNLIKHRKTQHEHVRYPCDQCDFISTQSTNLNAHKKAIHTIV